MGITRAASLKRASGAPRALLLPVPRFPRRGCFAWVPAQGSDVPASAKGFELVATAENSLSLVVLRDRNVLRNTDCENRGNEPKGQIREREREVVRAHHDKQSMVSLAFFAPSLLAQACEGFVDVHALHESAYP